MKLRRVLDGLYIFQVVVTIVVLFAVIGFMVRTYERVGDIQRNQIRIVQEQNDTQICAQYQIIRGTKSIAKSLGLPTRDIVLPDIEGLDCER